MGALFGSNLAGLEKVNTLVLEGSGLYLTANRIE